MSAAVCGSLFGFLGAATPCGGAGFASVADGTTQLISVEEFKVRWRRPMGLPEFEDPRENAARIELAAAAYLSAAGGNDRANLLAPMPLTVLNQDARLAAVVQTAGTEAVGASAVDSSAAQFADATMVSPREISRVARGVYRSALTYLVARADAWVASPAAGEDESLAAAVTQFRDELSTANTRSLENPRFAMRLGIDDSATANPSVWFHDSRTPAVGEQSRGTRQEMLTLPRLTDGFRVDSRSLLGLASQFEEAIEENLVLSSDGGDVSLDFEVAARPLGDGRTVELAVAFVGPAAAPAVPVKRFALNYRGGNGAILRTASADAGARGDPSDAVYDLPTADAVLGATVVTLFRVRDGEHIYLTDWVADGSGAQRVDIRLDTVFEQPEMFSIGALQAVFESVLITLQSEDGAGGVPGGDLIGVFVTADDGQLDLSRGGLDVRPADADGVLAIKAVPAIVNAVRAIAAGERVDPAERVDPSYPRFDRIRERAPFLPSGEIPQVLRERPLREYLDKQSRHPNRRVDAALTAPEWSEALEAVGMPEKDAGARWREQGTVGVDLLVTENKPWAVLVQGSNTGVEATGEWQTRVGYFNSDLFGNDEIFSLEYVTTNFSDSNGVNAYFDAPIGESDALRWKIYAGWSEYTASDVGLVFADFEGESPRIGAEVAWNVAQWGKTFLDLVGGVSWTNIEVFNGLSLDRGDEDFLVPYLGARLQRNDRAATTDFAVFLEFGLGNDSSITELNRLGRLFPDQDWQVLRWDLAQSFYLDPLFQDPGNLANATLAHELYFRFHGQNSLGNRLVPQFMGTAGGFYTVRGYPTSIIAGDNVYLFTGEYRLHFPQLLGIDPNPQPFMGLGVEPFRLRPQFGYGPTDWDLVFRAFVDAAVVENANRLGFERDEELIGVGFGVELQLYKGLGHPVLRNTSLRLDVGFPLSELSSTEVDDAQVTFVGTLSF
jgi:hemolysin activation/secretion protein